jgi:hypothetical protein
MGGYNLKTTKRARHFAILGCFVAASVVSSAAYAGSVPIITTNTYDKNIWITIYDVGKTQHLDYGCVPAKGKREWRAGNYFPMAFYYVRAQVMDGKDCKGNQICDTTVRVNIQGPGPEVAGRPLYGSGATNTGNKVTLIPNKNNCYWKTEPY